MGPGGTSGTSGQNGTSGSSGTSPAGGAAIIVLDCAGAFSTVRCGVGNCVSNNYGFAGGGYNNTASGLASFVGGGQLNQAFATYSTIVAGQCNRACSDFTFIGGGINGSASGNYSFIGGGQNGITSGTGAFVGAGISNQSCTPYSGIVAGFGNIICSTSTNQSFIGSGQGNCICCGSNQSIVGGQLNCINSQDSFIGGGSNNLVCQTGAFGFSSAILAGRQNRIVNNMMGGDSYLNFIGSGCCNVLCGTFGSVIGGGISNSAYNGMMTGSSAAVTISGGQSNRVSCCFTSIGGGCGNCACANNSRVGGGINNRASGIDSIVAGGSNNFVSSVGCQGGILGGNTNCVNHARAFVVGSNLTSGAACTSYHNASSKTSGTFRISHPDPAKTDSKYLQHSFVESPTRGDNIYRYKVTTCNCSATLALPDYYKFLNENDQVWVSPVCHFGSAYGVIDSCQTCVTFTSNCDGDYNVLLIGTRKDIDAKNGFLGVEVWK
jgi:hypothetical protein